MKNKKYLNFVGFEDEAVTKMKTKMIKFCGFENEAVADIKMKNII